MYSTRVGLSLSLVFFSSSSGLCQEDDLWATIIHGLGALLAWLFFTRAKPRERDRKTVGKDTDGLAADSSNYRQLGRERERGRKTMVMLVEILWRNGA
jgi:predicted SprT family Zn-dependent metalloprotease